MPALSAQTVRNSFRMLLLAAVACIAGTAWAQKEKYVDVLKAKAPGGGKPLADFKFDLSVGQEPGTAVLKIDAEIPPNHYIFSVTDDGAATRVEIKEQSGLVPLDELPVALQPPKMVDDPDLGRLVEKHFKKATWTQRFRIVEGEPAVLKGQVVYQICDERNCRPNNKVPFELQLAAAPPAADPREEAEEEPAHAPLLEEDEPPAARSPTAVLPDLSNLTGKRGGPQPVPTFAAALRKGANASEVVFDLQVTIPPDFYIYSTGKNGGAETEIDIETVEGLSASDVPFIADHPPVVVKNEARIEGLDGQPETVEHFVDKVTWSRTYERGKGPFRIAGIVNYQICGHGQCRVLKFPFDVSFAQASPDVVQLTERAATGTRGARGPVEVPDVATEPAAKPGSTVEAVTGIASYKTQGLLFFLTAAVVAGFAALLTPCVFPMIPITVSFFQKQAEKQHHRPVSMALVYCLGIIGTFTGLGLLMSALFGAASLTTLANNPWLNLFIAAVMVFFAMNLLGMFEIRMPGWLLTYTANQEGRGGFLGVLFMALTFTLTSFTCTFAFAGALLAAAANGDRLWPALGLLAFSAAFSLPFFFLALFPSFLQKLPKSGGWMNVAKVLMGLIELGAAFKFLSVADLSWHPVAWIFDYELVLSAWMIISITGGLYLLGMFRLPHDIPTEHIGVARFVSALSFLGLAAYLAVGLYASEKPTGKVWENILAFAPPKFSGSKETFGPALEHGGVKYALDFQKAIEYAKAKGKPVFVDFTGVNCANCRKMEKGPLSQPQIIDRLKNFVCVQVFTDRVPVIPDQAEAARLLKENLKLQEWFGDNSLPSYAVMPANPQVAAGPTNDGILSVTVGYNPNEEEFAKFLDAGWSAWQKKQAQHGAGRVVGQR